MFVFDANVPIIKHLAANNRFWAKKHSPSICTLLRCKEPIIYRATAQWFASVDGFREAALMLLPMKLNGFLPGVSPVFTIWSPIAMTGVFHANAYGAYQFCFLLQGLR
jgi:valyl-tRNA synthetase